MEEAPDFPTPVSDPNAGGISDHSTSPKNRAALGPFARLARVQLVSAAGDALFTIALAGSLFFNLDPAAARPKVALF